VYPVVLSLTGKRCLVVGGGAVARRKVEGLLGAGARVRVVAPEVEPEIAALEEVEVEQRPYRSDDLDGCWLVIAATDDPDVQQQVYDDGDRARVWVNAADDPARCAFYLPAVLRRAPVLVAVSTEGRSPALAAWLRDRIAKSLPSRLDVVAERLADERRDLRAAGVPTEGRDWSERIEALVNEAAADEQPGSTPEEGVVQR
jgi:precorrin-2 dehydrogenase/sirohydrochlorin ferrochelatase